MTDEQKRKCIWGLFRMVKVHMTLDEPMCLYKMVAEADQLRPLSLPLQEMRAGFINHYEHLRKERVARQRIQSPSLLDEISVKAPAPASEDPIEVRVIKPTATNTTVPRPPINAEFILHLFLRDEEQDPVIGDLLERYAEKYERLGKRRSDLWFCAEVFRSVWPLLRRAFGRLGGVLLLEEWFRRLLH